MRKMIASLGQWDPVPLFKTVYHDCAIQFGNYPSLTHPPYDDLWPPEINAPMADLPSSRLSIYAGQPGA